MSTWFTEPSSAKRANTPVTAHAHCVIATQHNLVVAVIFVADRQRHAQLPFRRLMPNPRGQPPPQKVKFSFAHRSLQTENQTVREIARMIHTVVIRDQRVAQGAQVQQLIPVRRVPGQARHLDTQDQADLAQPDRCHQRLEPAASSGFCARTAQVLVHHDHLGGVPAQLDGPPDQLVLAFQALGVVPNLRHTRLAHIHHRLAASMRHVDFGHLVHESSSSRSGPSTTPRAIIRANKAMTRT